MGGGGDADQSICGEAIEAGVAGKEKKSPKYFSFTIETG